MVASDALLVEDLDTGFLDTDMWVVAIDAGQMGLGVVRFGFYAFVAIYETST